MNPTRLFSLLTLAFALLAAPAALAQEPAPAAEMAEMSEDAPTANAEAREQYAASLEEARTSAEQATPEGFIAAGERYLEAAELAATSGDAELEAQGTVAKEAAVKAFVDAGSAYSSAEDYTSAAAQFERAAQVAEEIGNVELQAKTLNNAAVAYVSAEDFPTALERVDAAILLLPDELNYQFIRAAALRSSGDLAGSAVAFDSLATRAQGAGDTDMLAKANENAGKTRLLVARAAIQEGDFRDAIGTLDEAAEYLGDEDTSLHTLYGLAYYRLGAAQVQAENFDAAAGSLRQAQDHARKAGQDKIVSGAQAQLDYIEQVKASQG